MMYLNEKEEKVIGEFLKQEEKYKNKKLTLKWADGSQVKAEYDSFIEDETDYELDDERYEEFWSFVFKEIERIDTPPIEPSDEGYFLVNYRNFPKEILVDGKKIN